MSDAEIAEVSVGGNMLFEIPYPAPVLWPNGRPGHWAAKHRATKKYRGWAKLAAMAAGRPVIPPGHRVQLVVTFYTPTKRRPDEDGCIGSLKAGIDGIADALGVNDSTFLLPRLQFGEPVKGGKVVVEILLVPGE